MNDANRIKSHHNMSRTYHSKTVLFKFKIIKGVLSGKDNWKREGMSRGVSRVESSRRGISRGSTVVASSTESDRNQKTVFRVLKREFSLR